MRRGSSYTASGVFAVGLLGACVQPIALGYNDAGDQGAQGAQGAGADAAPSLCLLNPTFLGSPTDDAGIPRGNRPSALLIGWQICDGNADINPGVCMLPPPAGLRSYLGLDVARFQGAGTSVSTPLAPSLPPGSYPVSVDLGLAVGTLRWGGFGLASTDVELIIYGSASPCGRDEELARLPVTNVDGWMTYSATLTTHKMFSNLVLVPSLQSAPGAPSPREAYLVLGNFQSKTCH